jgi:2-dehydropantoate 2-reductase
MTDKKVAVLGSGAKAPSIGGDLTNAGLDVVLLEQWPGHAQGMRSTGLRIEMRRRDAAIAVRSYHLCEVCTFTERFDIVLVLMKAYDTRSALRLRTKAGPGI